MFNKAIYSNRRRVLIEKMTGETGIILMLGNVGAPAQYKDNQYKFRQDSAWLYFFGIDEPGFAATIDLDSSDITIYGDDIDIDDIIWMGPQPSIASIAAEVGVSKTAASKELEAVISKAISAGRKIHFLPATRYATMLHLSSLLSIPPMETTSSGKGGCARASRSLVEAVISMRLIKEDCEIEQMNIACDLGYEMHTKARRGIRPGIIEQQIVGDMEAVALAKGWGVSFTTILTQHGEIFHNHTHDCIVEAGKLMVVDAGVEANSHYASDFTRTYPTGGKFTQMQRDIYQTVYECNELAFSLTKPGTEYREVHISTVEHMLDNLKSLGLVNGNPSEMAADGIGGLFMPHGLGHNIGLDVHDMEDYGENLVGYDPCQTRSNQLGLASLRMARKLVPGNVVTDEPGIYFIPALIEQWKKEGKGNGRINYSKLESYYNFGGIRLEDDVLITENGAKRMGRDRLPIAPDDIEKIMAEENS